MTDEQILELAKNCKIVPNKYKVCIIWKEELLEFARVMYNEGKEEEIRRQKTGIGYVNDVLFVNEF